MFKVKNYSGLAYVIGGILFITLCRCSAIQASRITNLSPSVNVQIVTPEEIKSFLETNPNAVKLERKTFAAKNAGLKDPKASYAVAQNRSLIGYYLGDRTGYDQLVAYNEGDLRWPSPRDVVATFQYPSNGGLGAILSYIEIFVDQSNYAGSAYVTNGGIGYRYITIVIEAQRTYWFSHRALFYGLL